MIDVVCFSTADWDAPLWTNKQHLMSRLAGSGMSVLYIDSLGLRAPGLGGRDLSRIAQRAMNWRPYATPMDAGLFHDRPLAVPFHGFAGARRVNSWLLSARFRRNVSRLGAEAAAVWTFNPGIAEFVEGHQGPLVYHCVDRLGAYPGIDREFIERSEQAIVRRAAAVIASSRPLVEHLERLGAAEVLYWPNPADVLHFNQVPEVVPGNSRPVVGFIGSIQPHAVDLDLVAAVARARPGWDFVLIGPVGMGHARARVDTGAFPSNVHFTGAIARHSLPDAMRDWAVAVIPYTLNEYMEGVFPMKVYEYLGAGLPVVSTSLPALLGEVEHVRFADGPTDFVREIESAIVTDTPVARAERKAYASRFSWESRVAEARALLTSLDSGARQASAARDLEPAAERSA